MADKTGDSRYGHRSGSGANEPPRTEKKETAPDWQPRQGGEETAPDQRDLPAGGAGADKAKGKPTRGYDEVGTRKHLEGSEQGPS